MKCNATLYDKRRMDTFTCELGTGHYDVSRPPPEMGGPPAERDPGGWHKDGEHVWADHAEGAAPHVDVAPPADPLPRYQASVRFGRAEGPNLDWESPYEITVFGPPAFVAHLVTSAADAFEEDAQR